MKRIGARIRPNCYAAVLRQLYVIEALEPRRFLTAAAPAPIPLIPDNPASPHPVLGVIPESGPAPRYIVHAQAGQIYQFSFSSYVIEGWVPLTLTDTLGAVLANPSPEVFWQASADQDVYLAVGDGKEAGSFLLTALSIAPGQHQTLPTAALLRIDQPNLFTDDYPGEVQVYSFHADAGQIIGLGNAGSDTMELLDAQGQPLTTATSDNQRKDEIAWQFSQAGTFYLRITAAYHSQYPITLLPETLIDDHPGGVESATPASFLTDFGGKIDYEGDIDYFRFRARAGQRYNFRSSNSRDDSIEIVDSAAQAVPDAQLATGLFGITFSPVADGDYFVRVSGTPTLGDDYQLIGTQAADDYPDNPADAPLVSLPFLGDISLDFNGDVDCLRFHALAGQTYALGLSGENYALYAADGSALLASGTIPWTQAGTQWVAPSEGGVILALRAREGYGDSYGHGADHTLGIGALSLSPIEGIAVAGPLAGDFTDGTLDEPGGADWYSFQAVADARYTFETFGPTFFGVVSLRDATVALYNASGQRLAEQARPMNDDSYYPASPELRWKAPDNGTYYLAVYSASAARTGTYRLHEYILDPLGTSPEHAAPLSLNQPFAGSVLTHQDQWLRVPVQAGQTYSITTSSVLGFRNYVDFSLRTGTSDDLTPVVLSDLPFSHGHRIDWTATADTDLYFQVTFNSYDDTPSGSTYTLLITAYGEPHDVIPIQPDASIDAAVGGPGDENWYSFAATAGNEYRFQTSLGSLPISFLSIVDADGDTLLASNDAVNPYWRDGTSPESLLAWTAPRSDQFFLRVASGDPSKGGTYTVSEARLSDDDPDTAEQAAPIQFGQTISGQLTQDDVDFFTFQGTAGQHYRVQFNSTALPNAFSALVLDSSGKPAWLTLGSNALLDFAPAFSGPCFVRIYTPNPSRALPRYSFSVSPIPDDYGDTPDQAVAIPLRAAISGEVDTALPLPGGPVNGDWPPPIIDTDAFSFQANAAQSYTIYAGQGGAPDGGVVLQLVSQDGQTLARSRLDSSITWVAPTGGTYYVLVSDESTRPGEVGGHGYTLDIVPTIDAGSASASPLRLFPSADFSFDEPGQVQYFSFHAAQGRKYEIDLVAPPDLFQAVTISVLAPDGKTVLVGPSFYGVVFTAYTTDTFYLRLASVDPLQIPSYSLVDPYAVVQDDPGEPDPGQGPDDQDALGGVPDDPYLFKHFYTWTQATLDLDSPGQLFSLDVTKFTRYRLLTRLESLSDTVLYLIDADGQTILDANDDSDLAGDGSSEIDWTAPSTGRYFLLVTAFDPSGDWGAYDLIAAETNNGIGQTRLELLPDASIPIHNVKPSEAATSMSIDYPIAAANNQLDFLDQDDDPLAIDDGVVYE